MAVDFGLLGNPVNPLQVLQSLALGQQQVQQRQQMEEERAGRQREMALREQQFGLQQQKLRSETQKMGLDSYAEAIQDVLRRPENERASTWDAYVDQFVAMGQPEAAQLRGRYSEQTARAMLAQAGKLSEFNKVNDPKLNITGTGNGSYVVQRGNQLLDPNSGQWIDYGANAAPVGQMTATPQQGGKTIDKFGADAMRKSMGPQAFEQWKQRHGITETGGADAPPPGFVLD